LVDGSSAACRVQQRELLGDLHGMEQRQDQHAGSQRHAIRNRGQAHQCLDRREPCRRAIGKMAANNYAIESKLTREANLFDVFRETFLH
jgi:hypothetical protein